MSEKNTGSNTQKFYKGYEPRPSSKDIMATRRYICTNGNRWIISLLLSLTACFIHVYGFSQCYNEAEKASIPAALMCYNNHVIGPRVVLDVFRAKESSTTNCECTVTSDTATKFNFSNYNNYHPGGGCGSVLIFSANGNFHVKHCYVDDMQLPYSNLTDTSVDISITGPKSAISTDYCVLIESGDSNIVLNLTCNGDILPSTTQTTTSITKTTTTTTTTFSSSPAETTSTGVSSTTSKQSTTPTTTMASETTSTPSKASTSTMSSTEDPSTSTMSSTDSEVSSTYKPKITTVHWQSRSTAALSPTWSYTIPVIGVGLILVSAIIIAACYNHRKSLKNLNKKKSSSNVNSPYSRDYTYEN